MSKHSNLPPSSAARRVACAGSRKLESLYPSTENEHSIEGEIAHSFAAKSIEAFCFQKEFSCLSEHAITLEMREGSELYLDFIINIVNGLCIPSDLFSSIFHIEEKVDISNIHPECWGTPDFYFIYQNELHLFDYKFGHKYVEVFENWQLIEYAAGIINTHCQNVKTLNIHFHIVQPRCYSNKGPVQSWSISLSDLQRYFSILKQAEAQAMSVDAKVTPNSECNYCTARHACPALQIAALTAADISTKSTPFNLTPIQIGVELRYLKRAADILEARITGLSAEATALLKKGESVAYWRLEESQGREKWERPAEEVITLGKLYNCELSKPLEPITPRQAVKAGIPESVVSAYVAPRKSSLKLVPQINSRKIFGR